MSQVPTAKSITVLLAEDESLIANAYKQGLTYYGFDVLLARDGKETLTILENTKPDILLLDIMMPYMNGLEVLEVIHSKPEHKNLPVIVLTNLGQSSDADQVEALGAKGYLIKANLSLKELIERINDALDIPPM